MYAPVYLSAYRTVTSLQAILSTIAWHTIV